LIVECSLIILPALVLCWLCIVPLPWFQNLLSPHPPASLISILNFYFYRK
jgi:hypothetical protein